MLKETSRLLQQAGFTGPELLVDEAQARRNIATMAARARAAGVRFRPHFKTHQSAAVGRWFADEGINAITVSSLEMAEYFADHGWRDITLALLLNPRQWPALENLAHRLDTVGGRLGVTVDSPAGARQLAERTGLPVDVWLKLDTGYGRTGLPWDDPVLPELASALQADGRWRGLLTHSGQSYAAAGQPARDRIWRQTLDRQEAVRQAREPGLQLSVGDTPCCWTVDDLHGADELRPGNFVFFDVMQYRLGVCGVADLAAAVVCPVIGLYPGQGRLVVHGGAVHLSREGLTGHDGAPVFGYVGQLAPQRRLLDEAPVTGLSQEHGVLDVGTEPFHRLFRDIEIGDLLLIWPVHSCLACDLHPRFRGLDGVLHIK